MCSVISEKHCETQYGSNSQHAVKDKIPHSSCPVRTLTQTSYHNTEFASVHLHAIICPWLYRAEDGFNKHFDKQDKFKSAILQAYRNKNVSTYD